MSIDADPTNRDWLRIVARMSAIRVDHPELTDAEGRIIAKRARLASLRRSATAG